MKNKFLVLGSWLLGIIVSAVILAGAAATGAPANTAKEKADPAAAKAKVQAAADKVFDRTKLHQIEITIDPKDAAQVATRDADRVHVTFVFDGVELKDVGLRQSGAMAHPYVSITNKPSFSVKFNDFVKGQDLFGITKITMKNGLQDMSYVNEHLTYEVFRRAGYPAPMTAHAQVKINGVDSGIYVLREAVDNQFFVRNFGKEAEDGNLYEVEYGRDPITYPMAIDLKDEKEQNRKRDDVLNLAAAAQAAPPQFWIAAVSPYLDIDRFITFMAVETQTSDYDSYPYNTNNSYVYHLPTTGKFLFIPHGADEAFWAGVSAVTRMSSVQQRGRSALSQTIWSMPDLTKKYQDEITRVSSDPVWNKQALLERVAQVAKILETATPNGPRTAADISRFNQYKGGIENFINRGGLAGSGR